MTKSILILFLCFIGLSLKASHIVGGEIYYDSLGNNQYKITIELFRDCQNSATPFDNPLSYTVFYANGSLFSTFYIDLPTPQILPIVYDDPCVTPPNDICVERVIYIDTVTLPFSVDGYYISYQRCCWANNIQNIVSPGDNGITLTTFIPGSNLIDVHNNSARFNDYPPLVLCSNNTLTVDHSAFDLDGDSLVYSLCSPLLGGSTVDVMPDPEPPAPYFPVNWEVGFSSSIPLGPGSTVTIDPQLGIMSFTPNLLGTFAIGVCVQEYRDAILINTNMRTFGYRVVSCLVDIPLTIDLVGPPNLIEDCGFSGFIITRTDATDSLAIQVFLSGTALNGIDYQYLEDTLILVPGVLSDTIGFSPLYDGLTEGNETVYFNIVVPNPCDNTFDTTSTVVTIIDYLPMNITSEDSINVCAETGDTGVLWCNVANGVSPYTYYWSPDLGYPNNDTISINSTDLEPNLNLYRVEIIDQCNKTIESIPIEVYNQCPLVVPNVITLNNDNINEYLIINNLEDYDAVHLKIFNRWGNLIYENENYQNDWSGTSKNNQVNEGVYFYTVTPKSEKYTYDDVQKTEFTLHGFFHVIK